MSRFTTLTSSLAPLPIENVDTDQIIPAVYLKVIDKTGLGEGLFAHWRYLESEGRENPDFVLNRPQHKEAKILLAGENFGCGSSREHAPWALVDYGFRAVISSRFADIFRNNSLKNGLLTVTLPEAVCARLFEAVEADPGVEITIELESQTVTLADGEAVHFDIDPFAKHCLLSGVDQLGYLIDRSADADRYEQRHPTRVDTSVATLR
jgi:3-isopropylmalate/(R)-2-methylmalate dehydratase small subunit